MISNSWFSFQKACLTKCVNKTDLLAQCITTKLATTENFDSIRPQNSRVVLVDKIEILPKLYNYVFRPISNNDFRLDNFYLKFTFDGHFGGFGEQRIYFSDFVKFLKFSFNKIFEICAIFGYILEILTDSENFRNFVEKNKNLAK